MTIPVGRAAGDRTRQPGRDNPDNPGIRHSREAGGHPGVAADTPASRRGFDLASRVVATPVRAVACSPLGTAEIVAHHAILSIGRTFLKPFLITEQL